MGASPRGVFGCALGGDLFGSAEVFLEALGCMGARV